jgi:thiamine biosynthesis lipoprotein
MSTHLRRTTRRAACLLVGASVLLSGCWRRGPVMVSGNTMGTTWSLRSAEAGEDVRRLVQGHLDRREAVLSHWRRDSAVGRFNQVSSTDWQPVPRELVEVVRLARRIADDTEGALDITLAPAIEAAGFAPTMGPATTVTGWSHLQLRDEPPALKKDVPELRINVASVTEGFVIDELAVMLKARGLKNFLLEVGGEVSAAGLAPGGRAWWAGIQDPGAPQGEVLQQVPVSDLALSTSGTYRHRKEGRSHLIDPRTLLPVAHELASVTVLHPSCALADGYATALMVLGPERGRAVAERLGLRVIWITQEQAWPGDGSRDRMAE